MIRRRKNVQKRLLLIILFLIDSILYVSSQALYGTTGLLHAPTAEMQNKTRHLWREGMCYILFRCSISVVMR